MELFSNLLVFLLIASCFKAHFVTAVQDPAQDCYYGCVTVFYYVTFTKPYSYDICQDELFRNSIYFCASIYCSENEVKAGFQGDQRTCKAQGHKLPSVESVVGHVDLDVVERISRSDGTASANAPLDHPVVPDADFFDVALHTSRAFNINFRISYDFSYAFYGFWALVVHVGIVHRLLDVFHRRRLRNMLKQRARTRLPASSSPARLWLWIRRCLILPSGLNSQVEEAIGMSVLPPRLESLILTLFIVLNFVACFPGYHVFLPNLYYDKTKTQLLRYISDRTGILATANLPLIWLFATPNDPLLWLTGWSFATYNRFHSVVARVATLQAIVHSIGYTVWCFYESPGEYALEWKYRYWWCGAVATITMSLAMVLAIYQLRQKYYDLFLALHIGLAIVFLVTMWYHVNIWGQQFVKFLYPCIAIWAVDRLLRLGRIVYHSILPRYLKGVTAVATYDKQSEMIRIDVTDFLREKTPKPGRFYYVYLPAAIRGYESHPFSLCSWKPKEVSSPIVSSAPSLADDRIDKEVQVAVQSSAPSTNSEELRHTFLVRPYEGFTKRLRDKISSSSESRSSCQINILLEGPYGHTVDLRSYSNVLMICGGSGITAAIPHSHMLLHSGLTAVQVIWALPQRHLVDDVSAHELGSALGHPCFTLDVYLTGAAVVEDGAIEAHGPYGVHFGRPDLHAVMEQARSKCTHDLAIVSCGTPMMADACRKAVVKLLKDAGPNVGYFDDSQTW